MAPAYKLLYFDAKGIGEAARFLLLNGGLEFEDVRIKKEEWPQWKEKTPFGHVPVLEHDGKKVWQSVAICRYLGKITNLAGKDDWENLEIDSVVDTFTDLRHKTTAAHVQQDPDKKKKMKETVLNETIPYYFTRWDAQVQKNQGHLALGRLTWADFLLVSFATAFDDFVGEDPFAKYPNLKVWREKMEALPAIKKWIETRPKSNF